MKKISLLKKYTTIFLLFFMISVPICYNNQSAITVSASEIQPLSDDIRWVYKKENGKYYKRLYNYTNQTWIGDWIQTTF